MAIAQKYKALVNSANTKATTMRKNITNITSAIIIFTHNPNTSLIDPILAEVISLKSCILKTPYA